MATEAKEEVKIYISNLPEEVRLPIVRLAQIDARLAALRAAIASGQNGASAYGSATGSIANQRMGAMLQREVNSCQAEVNALSEERVKVSATANAAKAKDVFAMFVGAYSRIGIWECGVRR